MAKRRTKKEKRRARKRRIFINKQKVRKHRGGQNKANSPRSVKGQTDLKQLGSKNTTKSNKVPNNTANNEDLASIKKDLIKSLSLSGLILGLELVIYYFWQ